MLWEELFLDIFLYVEDFAWSCKESLKFLI